MSDAFVLDWLRKRGWRPFPFQRRLWRAVARGQSGLLHATTGAGKTYAALLGALSAFHDETPHAAPLTLLWVTPMRALAADTVHAIEAPVRDLQPGWTVGARNGDTSAAERARQTRRLPSVLVITPESLSLMLSSADAKEVLSTTRMVVVDEWHELVGNKRGVQVQLALARLAHWNTALCVWALSATLGNLEQAMHALLGTHEGVLVEGAPGKPLVIDTLLPPNVERFPWAGHLGLTMLPQVVEEIDASSTTLVFTNTRSQSEIWYQALLDARPDWAGVIALHHGSLDHALRGWVEEGLKTGSLRAVVCTSSLDLGVDFLPVERVLQIGSARGVARLLQRAGRSGHAPGRTSRVTLVPTHSIELLEGPAARAAIAAGHIEARESLQQPLDVLVQHLVTVALGGGFEADALFAEVRNTAAYADLSPESWQWCLDFVRQGGASLTAYPDYRRAAPDADGVWRVPDARLARRHRMNIGTIVRDVTMTVQYVGGTRLGTVEEGFVARLKPGESFTFGGRALELVRIHEMTAWVKRARSSHGATPRWSGSRMPLSTTLADAVLDQLARASAGVFDSPELQHLRPLLDVQQRWSALPTPETLLAEVVRSREGTHLFLYPFAGRHVHLGLANLIAWRVAKRMPRTFSIAVNDLGLELLCAIDIDWPAELAHALAPTTDTALLDEIMASLNASELAQRRFREIARVSGLIYQGHPGERRGSRQIQASSSLFWQVFRTYDPQNKLLRQAEQELLAYELDIERLRHALTRMRERRLVLTQPQRPTPFAVPLMVERFREMLTSEKLANRIARMIGQLEKAAGNA